MQRLIFRSTKGKSIIVSNEFKIIENQQLGSNGKEFSRLVYTGKQGVFDLKFEQYFWVGKEKAYVLTFTTEENEYANYKSIGEKILNSFHIK